ncbi:MAG: cbb3-type cytochrome c oxidase subunit I [Bryobacteraceae bacterium]
MKIFSTDHKVIGKQYFFLALFSVVIGIVLSAVMRFHLSYPDAKVKLFAWLWRDGAPGGVMTPELYLSLMTMHGTIMVFFVLTAAPQSGFGNYFLPLQIGAPDMAFPRLNALSFWTTLAGLIVLLAAFFVPGGAPLGGWTAYPPLSGVGEIAGPGQGLGMDLWIVSIALFSAGSLMGAINFIATFSDLRAEGVDPWKLPLTCWAWFTTAVISLLGFAVLLAAGILLLMDRNLKTSFFLPSDLVVSDRIQPFHGGSPLLWQHLFWFFGHPEVYIVILPAMGIISTVLSVFSRKPVFGYKAMVYAMMAIAILGYLVWGHHMFVSGMSPYSAIAFSLITMAVGVPSAIKTFNWIGTIWGGRIWLNTPMLFALGFISLFVSGGITGIFLGQPAVDLYMHDTYFVVGHFHIIMGVAAIFAILAGTYYWFPRMFGRMMNEALGKIHFFVTFVGVYAIFVPMHLAGIVGNPRRYPDFKEFEFLAPLKGMHTFMTHAAFLTAAIQLVFLFNLFWSMKKGKPAPENPWDAPSREWTQ